MSTILGVNFGRDIRGALKHWRNKAEEFAEKNPDEFAEKIAGNFPIIRQTDTTNSSQVHSAEPRYQRLMYLNVMITKIVAGGTCGQENLM